MIELHVSREDLELIEMGLKELHGRLNVTNPVYERYKDLLQMVHITLHPDEV